MGTRYFVYRDPAFHSRDEATDAKRRQASLAFDGGWGTTFCLRSPSKESISLRPARIGTIRRVMAGPFVGPLAFEKPRVARPPDEENSRGLKYPLRLYVSPYAISFSLSLFPSHHFVS